ncbi:PilZ domain-containing protein [Ramlibacter sp.]|jgi:hypothetical protein|uniref:PilZ domain-containing protein n=1 Tax=Ramlibacter sp. TaxID=1917967 RepID=UPI0026359EF4|nr:PilZ domain-containing protein [Ramlibacter sp.]MDB5955984.1 hypothetical protein [Ramlibacter sp.]
MSGAPFTIPVPLQTRDDRRRAERFVAAMPVSVDGREGTTQDLSASGLSFTADRPYALGTRVEVVIEYLLDGHNYPLRCEAEVVRSTPCDDGYTIGARLAARADTTGVPVADADAVMPGSGVMRARLRPVD